MPKSNDDIKSPVGLRWRRQNVTNNSDDQAIVIDLLSRIPASKGGKRDAWKTPPLSGPKGNCPKVLADAIWDFQVHWKQKGEFHVIDGVVDPGRHTSNKMNELALRVNPPEPPRKASSNHVRRIPRIHGTWQVTNIWSAALGEGGQLGSAEVEITQPDNKKFLMRGFGAGVGVGIDPIKAIKLLKGVVSPDALATVKEVLTMLGTGVGFNIGDYLQKLGVSLPSVTRGCIFANPINKHIGRPQHVSRYMLTGGAAREPFSITSVGGAVGAGMEGGVISFGFPLGPLSHAFAIYGSSGVNAKFGAGAQVLVYHLADVVDK